MSSREFAEWLAYYQIQPFGENRADERSGTIAAAIVNVHRKKGVKPLNWLHFFPPDSERNPVRGWQGLLDKAAAIVARYNK